MLRVAYSGRRMGKSNEGHLQSRLGFSIDGKPSILTISGHFCAGKSEFYGELVRKMHGLGIPIDEVINYKMRDPRPGEVLGSDYIPVKSVEQYNKDIESGIILVPYLHDGRHYGLSSDFKTALDNNSVPLMITDTSGLTNLINYLDQNNISNSVIPFMIHTSKDDAIKRLFARASSSGQISDDEIRGIQSHVGGLNMEFDSYNHKEDLFRHIYRNDTIEGIERGERLNHLTDRALDDLSLEKVLNKTKTEDFREGKVDYVIKRLFGGGASLQDLIGSMNQGVLLTFPEELIDKYSIKNGISPTTLKRAVTKRVIGPAEVDDVSAYGFLTLYLEPTLNPQTRRYLIDLIEETVGLTHQYRQRDSSFSETSRLSLKQMVGNYSQFLISFSSYDPMRTPPLGSRIHTINFEGLLNDKKPSIISPVNYRDAHRFIEGNGYH